MKQKLSVAPTLKNYDKKNLPKDILAGIIIMAVSGITAVDLEGMVDLEDITIDGI